MSMQILKDNFITTTPKDLPISFKMNDKTYNGIPEDYKTETDVTNEGSKKITTFIGANDAGLQIKVVMTEYTDFPAVEYVAFFTNTANEKTSTISNLKVYNKTFDGIYPYFTYGNGDTHCQAGFDMKTEQIQSPLIVETKLGLGACGASPFMRVMTEDYGLNIAVGWPGDWSFTISPVPNEEKFSLSLGQKRFRTYILPGETMRTPSITLMPFAGNEDLGRNLWRRFYFAHIIPKPLDPKFVIGYRDSKYDEWAGTTEEHQLETVDKLLDLGYKPDIWWIDAGWYECDHKWWYRGTWKPNPENWPNGMNKLGTKLKKEGIDFLLWFEPECASVNTEMWNEHPEWIFKKTEDQAALVNFGNKDCLEWITDRIDSIIKEAGVTIYRQDFNFINADTYWILAEGGEREGAVENLHIQGYLAFWDALLERNPGLLIDSCAGGGRRNEMETLKRSVPLHYTDIGYGQHTIKQKQYRYMQEWIPYYRTTTSDWRNDNDTYLYYPQKEKPANEFCLHNSLAPAMWFAFGLAAPEQTHKRIKDFMVIWKKAADIMLSGDYYPLTEHPGSTKVPYAVQFDNPETRTGFIQVINNVDSQQEEFVLQPHFEEGGKYTFEAANSDAVFEINNKEFNVKIKKGTATLWFYNY